MSAPSPAASRRGRAAGSERHHADVCRAVGSAAEVQPQPGPVGVDRGPQVQRQIVRGAGSGLGPAGTQLHGQLLATQLDDPRRGVAEQLVEDRGCGPLVSHPVDAAARESEVAQPVVVRGIRRSAGCRGW